MYQSEEEFLKNYDASTFEKLSMTTDILIISVSDEEQTNYRKTSKKKMSILLVKRDEYPFKDMWCLPGGFLNPLTETLEQCAKRVLENETNVKDIYLEQLYTFDALTRDPRMRVVSTSFLSLIDKNRLNIEMNPNASWFDVSYTEEENKIDVVLDNKEEILHLIIEKKITDKATGRYQLKVISNQKLAFDHPSVIVMGIERLRNKIEYTDIVFHMMKEYFTLGELQQVYEVILGKKLFDPAFRRIIASKVEKTDKMKTGEGHRPSFLFRYKRNDL